MHVKVVILSKAKWFLLRLTEFEEFVRKLNYIQFCIALGNVVTSTQVQVEDSKKSYKLMTSLNLKLLP